MATIRRDNIILELIARFEKFRKALDDQERKVSGFANTMARAQKAVIGFFAARLSKDLVVGLFNAAAGLQALTAKAAIVFGESLPRVTKAANENAIAMGLSRAEYIAAAAGIQDLLVPLGIQRDEATSVTIELINMSGALSEWTAGQKSATEVAEILQKAILGEREQLKTLGVSITEAEVQARVLENTGKKLTGTALQQAKAFATLELITEKTTDAQTNAARKTQSLASQQRAFSAAVRDSANSLAKELVPAFASVTGITDPNTLSKGFREFVATMAAMLSVLLNSYKVGRSGIKKFLNEIEIAVVRNRISFAKLFFQDTKELQQRLDNLIDDWVDIVEAGNIRINEEAERQFALSIERQENALLETAAAQTQIQLDEQKRRNEQLSAEEKKRQEEKKKEELEAQKNIEDLRVELLKDAQEQAIQRLKLDTDRVISSLTGTPEQIREQTQLLARILNVELAKIAEEFAKLKKRIEPFDPLETISLSEGQGVSISDEIKQEQLRAANTAAEAEREARRQIAEEQQRIRDERRKTFDQFVDQSEEITKVAIKNVKASTEARMKEIDREILAQQSRVSKINEIDSKATADQIELEEQRLAKLQAEREKFVQKQRVLAGIEIGINTAATIPAAIRAIVEGFGENLATGILKAAALATTVVSTILAVRRALSNVPSFTEGIERLMGPGNRKSDSIAVFASKDERIVPGDINEQIGFDFPNKKLPKAVAFYKKYAIPGPSADAINAPLRVVQLDQGELLAEMVRMRKAFNALHVEFNVSDEGIYAAVTKQQQRIDHQKALAK